MRVSRILFLAATLALAVSQAAYSLDTSSMIQAENRARQSNNPNDWTTAGNMWLSAAKFGMNDLGKMRPGTEKDAIAMARRAAACFTRSFNISPDDTVQHRGIEYDSRLNPLRSTYDLLARLEPNNGLWYYLVGEQYAAVGHYIEAKSNLEMAVRLSGGQPAGQKAQKLLAHIAPFEARDSAANAAEAPTFGQIGNILQNQNGANGSETQARLDANSDRIHGRKSHGYAAQFRTEGNTGD